MSCIACPKGERGSTGCSNGCSHGVRRRAQACAGVRRRAGVHKRAQACTGGPPSRAPLEWESNGPPSRATL
eukprot:14517160-Alexandrium_andersonii.AAC.1